MRRASLLDTARLRPEFRQGMDALRARIMATAPAKTLFGEQLDGKMLVALAQQVRPVMGVACDGAESTWMRW